MLHKTTFCMLHCCTSYNRNFWQQFLGRKGVLMVWKMRHIECLCSYCSGTSQKLVCGQFWKVKWQKLRCIGSFMNYDNIHVALPLPTPNPVLIVTIHTVVGEWMKWVPEPLYLYSHIYIYMMVQILMHDDCLLSTHRCMGDQQMAQNIPHLGKLLCESFHNTKTCKLQPYLNKSCVIFKKNCMFYFERWSNHTYLRNWYGCHTGMTSECETHTYMQI